MASGMSLEINGAKEAIAALRKGQKNMRRGIINANRETAVMGLAKARRMAPHFSGATSLAISKTKSHNIWVIQQFPPADHPQFNVGLRFQQDNFAGMTVWGPNGTRLPFRPFIRDTNSIRWWGKTMEFMQRNHASNFRQQFTKSIYV